ncbi:MAG: hotdog fold thioesterase [Truepera sp.]|nr:hotdog fold thioesterase [Truepera sp.]MBS3968067.1 hotdog fold thioesterase [Truepera sp.]
MSGPSNQQLDVELLRQIIEEMIPLNKFLGLKLESCDLAGFRVSTRLAQRPEFIGNPIRQMAHGGIISFLIDATAGAAAALSVSDTSSIDKIATIDMRVDYLKPAKGSALLATAAVVHSGSRVIVVRSDVFDDLGSLVALGSNVFNVAR